jgi:ParB family chromosome partitioning protein
VSKKNFLFSNNPLLAGPKFDDRLKSGIPYREVPVELIERDPNQPRVHFDSEKLQELSDSIKTYGVLSPLLVKPIPASGKFKLIAGERRFRASQLAGLTSVPVLVSGDTEENEAKTLSMQLVENLQRSDLTPLERAHAIAALKDAHGLSIRDVADKLGISKSMVQRSLDILNLPADLLNALREGASESKILLLSKIEDPALRATYLKDIDSLTRNEIDQKTVSDGVKKHSAKVSHDQGVALTAEDQRIVDEIQRAIGLKVKMTKTSPAGEGGKLAIEFYSAADLQELFRKLIA